MRFWNKKSMPGDHYDRIDTYNNAETCINRCLAETRCVAFEYLKDNKLCFLKDDTANLASNSFSVAGVRCNQASPTEPADGTYPSSAPAGETYRALS